MEAAAAASLSPCRGDRGGVSARAGLRLPIGVAVPPPPPDTLLSTWSDLISWDARGRGRDGWGNSEGPFGASDTFFFFGGIIKYDLTF